MSLRENSKNIYNKETKDEDTKVFAREGENSMKKHRTPQEILEIRQFVLGEHLKMIKMSFYALVLFSSSLYFMIANLYIKEQIDLAIFVVASILFIIFFLFLFTGIKSMRNQQKSIKNLKTIFEIDK